MPHKRNLVLALDLEATLISDVFSQIPRPGLRSFLDFCYSHFPRIVIFTGASEVYFRKVANKLVATGEAPSWFPLLEYINWDREVKDLRFIPNAAVENIILVDDYFPYIHPEQTANWIEVLPFDEDSGDDQELVKVQALLSWKLSDSP